MAFKSLLKLNAKIFDKTERTRVLGNVAIKTARDFREQTRLKMVESRPTGKIYERSNGRGFTRSHRASRRGQRPAIDTGNLANRSLKAMRISPLSAKTFIDEKVARYGERLQEKLDRPIMSKADVRVAEIQFQYNANEALKGLL